MPQDAFTLKHIKNELQSLLIGGKISRINQPLRDSLTFIIYTQNGTLKLDICLSAQNNGLFITKNEKVNPAVAPNFCMLCRKHLQNAQITAVEQVGFERIIYFDFDCFSEFEQTKMRLYFEIMGKYSNAVLTQNGVILGALKPTALGEDVRRTLFPGVAYTLPEPQEKADPTDLTQLNALFEAEHAESAKFICDNVKGIAYATALDMIDVYGEEISAAQVYEYVNGQTKSPCVILRNGEPVDFAVRNECARTTSYPTVLQAQTAYYEYATQKRNFADKKRKLQTALSAAVKKCEKRRAQINDKLLECEGAEQIKLFGELITANIYAIERGMSEISVVNYYDEKGEKINIALDVRLTPAQNAQKYYKKYAKLKRTQENLVLQQKENETRFAYLESIDSSICAAEYIVDFEEIEEELKNLGLIKTYEDRRKKKPTESPFRQYEMLNFTILAGRNNLQNDRLLRQANANDLWLHTQKYHSSHVIVLTENRPVPDEVIKFAAEIAAHYSSGKTADKVPVDYALKKHVKKPPKSNAGFVIYTDYKTIIVAPNAHADRRIHHGK